MSAPESAVELEVSGMSHTYATRAGSYLAIADLNFQVKRRELVTIVGPSGAGKTTLLKCVSGLIRPSAGAVSLRGRVISDVPEGVALVFQDYSRSLYPWLTVTQNVEFPLSRRSLTRAQRRARSDVALEAVGLGSSRDRYPWQLSGGMQQRVAIARALAYEPSLLIMDEPFASLDAQTREDLEDAVLVIRDSFDVTILFVTHDIDESVYLSDRVLVLSSAPARVLADIHIDLPRPRDQISTRRLNTFVEYRTEIASMIRSQKVKPPFRQAEQ